MSNQYAGLMIGGPMAGRQIVHSNKQFTCAERPKRPPLKVALRASIDDKPVPDDWTFKTHTYTWTHIGPFALWLHESTDLNQALNDMAQAYQEKHRVV